MTIESTKLETRKLSPIFSCLILTLEGLEELYAREEPVSKEDILKMIDHLAHIIEWACSDHGGMRSLFEIGYSDLRKTESVVLDLLKRGKELNMDNILDHLQQSVN